MSRSLWPLPLLLNQSTSLLRSNSESFIVVFYFRIAALVTPPLSLLQMNINENYPCPSANFYVNKSTVIT